MILLSQKKQILALRRISYEGREFAFFSTQHKKWLLFPGEYLLGAIDACTRWPETLITKSIGTQKVISFVLDLITSNGIPNTIVTDNGPQLKSSVFKEFCKSWNIKHRKVTPYWPQANGEIEIDRL